MLQLDQIPFAKPKEGNPEPVRRSRGDHYFNEVASILCFALTIFPPRMSAAAATLSVVQLSLNLSL
jgi:hypothetical protein